MLEIFFVVFLTNRSLAATRRHSLTHMREIRAAVADAVVRASDRCVVPKATLIDWIGARTRRPTWRMPCNAWLPGCARRCPEV